MNENLIFAGIIGAGLYWAYTRVEAANQARIKQWQESLDLRDQLNQLRNEHAQQRRQDLEAMRLYVIDLERNWKANGAAPPESIGATLSVWVRERLANRI